VTFGDVWLSIKQASYRLSIKKLYCTAMSIKDRLGTGGGGAVGAGWAGGSFEGG